MTASKHLAPGRVLAGIGLVAALVASAAPASAQSGVELEEAFPKLPDLVHPVDIQVVPDGSSRIALVEQVGRISLVDSHPEVEEAAVLLDIVDRVNTQPSWEEGLLGVAFHPDYAENGRFYVHYTTYPAAPGGPHRTIIARFTRDVEGADEVDPATEEVLIELDQPDRWHNGGQVRFGPPEGPGGRRYLYLSLGDGGGVWDPFAQGQDPTTLLGTVLRIDVDASAGDLPYVIPSDNPFVGNDQGWREEIFAYGLRNPWRFSFDFETERLWLGDVGQNTIEEVNLIVAGGNFGWPVKEGTLCGRPPQPGEPQCTDPGLIDPVWEYTHAQGDRAVTGGYVYRGTAVPGLVGRYVYADFISGRMWALTYDVGIAPENELLLATGMNVTTFGLDQHGELLLASYAGRIYRVVEHDIATAQTATDATGALELVGPNPARRGTVVVASAATGQVLRLDVFDLTGRAVMRAYDAVASSPRTEVPIDGAGLRSGVYVARLTVDGRPAGAVRFTILR